MTAEVVQLRCQHVQDYGERYHALKIQTLDGSFLLRVPMHQYEPIRTREILQQIANKLNEK